MNKIVISMQSYRKQGSRMFSGREFGVEIREKMGLDKKDCDDKQYIVQVSDDTLAINSSFFGGLFAESVLKLKEDKFREKYEFQNEKGKDIKPTIRKDIEEGIYDAING